MAVLDPTNAPTTPPSVVVYRDEHRRDKRWSPWMNRRIPVAISPENAPPPVPYTSFYGMGKDPGHAIAHKQVAQSLAIADRLAVAAPNFLVKKVHYDQVVAMQRGDSIPVTGHVNIATARSESLGSRLAVQPAGTWSPVYAKLT